LDAAEDIDRAGRRLVLTESGKVVFRHADEMFRLGEDLAAALKRRPEVGPLILHCGTSDFVPKPVAMAALEPVLHLRDRVKLVCREWRTDQLLAELALHRLDVVLCDQPYPETGNAKALTQVIAETPIALYGTPELCERFRGGFPDNLDGAPMLMPSENQSLRALLDGWLRAMNTRVSVVGEFEDRALMECFGMNGLGLFAGSVVVDEYIRRMYGVEQLGILPGVTQCFYAIALDRKSEHPAVSAMLEAAKRRAARVEELV
jgi:LysR family transcriptional activator of nhaA